MKIKREPNGCAVRFSFEYYSFIIFARQNSRSEYHCAAISLAAGEYNSYKKHLSQTKTSLWIAPTGQASTQAPQLVHLE